MISVTAKELKKAIHFLYDRPDLAQSVMMIEGESGVGKTEIVLQTVQEMVNFEECRVINVAHLNPEDMGIPQKVNGWVEFAFSSLLKPPKEDRRIMLLLDEFNRPSNSNVLNMLMGMINERRIFGYPLPRYISFIGTLNPNTRDYTETENILRDLAMARRIQLIGLRYDQDQFLEYMVKHNGQKDLMQFLRANPDLILVAGKNNCPRNWGKLNSDVMTRLVDWKANLTLLKHSASMFMDTATLSMFLGFIEGSLERPVTGARVFEDWEMAREKLGDHLGRNKIDLVSATCDDVKAFVKRPAFKGKSEDLAILKEFLLLVPKAMSFTFIEDIVQNTNAKWKNFFLKEDELRALLESGTSKVGE